MSAHDGFEVIREIMDDSENHLTLRFVEIPQPKRINIPGIRMPDEKFYDFHSLVWDIRCGSVWQRKATITQDDLEVDGTRLWVSDLHSLDARNGTAIVKVAEGDWHVTYSWREWDLCRNKELRMIKVCDCPLGPFDDSEKAT